MKVLSEKDMAFEKLSSVFFSGQFHPVDRSDQLFCSMGHGNIIVFALTDFFRKICTKGFIPVADIFCRIEGNGSRVFPYGHMKNPTARTGK